jgi:uncharacterized membrane protein YoaK (UPF0700 family)
MDRPGLRPVKDETVRVARRAARLPSAAPLLVGAVLAAIAGWVDTLGFLGLQGVFTAHVTGNFVLLGTGLAGDTGAVAVKLLVLPAFVAGVACAAGTHAIRRGTASLLLLFEVAALAGFLLAGLRASPWLAACAGAFAMGVQNAQSRLSLSSAGATTAMTGNVTQLVLEGMGAAGLLAADRRQARQRMASTLAPVAGFAMGCAGGGLAWLACSFWALLVPIAVLCALACCAD